MRVSNEEVHKRANMVSISEQVKHRKWTWIGHVLPMDKTSSHELHSSGHRKENAKEEDPDKRSVGL